MFASLHLFDIALALHIIGVVAGFGLVLVAPLVVPAARRAGAGSGSSIAALQLAVSRIAVRWGGLLVLVSGIYLASKLDVFSEWWVSLPFVVIIVILGVNDGFLGPKYKLLVENPEDEVVLGQTRAGELVLAGLVLLAILSMVLGPLL